MLRHANAGDVGTLEQGRRRPALRDESGLDKKLSWRLRAAYQSLPKYRKLHGFTEDHAASVRAFLCPLQGSRTGQVGQNRVLGRCGQGAADRFGSDRKAAVNKKLTSLIAWGQVEHALFAEGVPDPGLAIGPGRAEMIGRDAALVSRIDLPRERDKIPDRAKMDVPTTSAMTP